MLGPTVGAAGTPIGRGANMAFWTATRRRTRWGGSEWLLLVDGTGGWFVCVGLGEHGGVGFELHGGVCDFGSERW